MPVYSTNSGIFSGHFASLAEPTDWRDRLPGLSLGNSMKIEGFSFYDLGKEVAAGGGLGSENGMLTIPDLAVATLNRMGALNIVTAIRSAVGQVAITLGYWTDVSTSVSGIFEDPLSDAADVLDVLSGIINSDYFQQALDGVTWIPIVGWIIRIVAEILKVIVKVSDWVYKKRIEKMGRELTDRFLLPVFDMEYVQDYQESKMHSLLLAVRLGQLETLFMPAYLSGGHTKIGGTDVGGYANWSNFEGLPAGHDSKSAGGDNYELATRWYLRTADPSGFGFVPGTSSINGVLEFLVNRCGAQPRSLGEFLPSVQTTAAYIWQNATREQPAAFSIRTDVVKEAWVNYVSSSLLFAIESLNKGYTCSETADFDSDREYCGPWNLGARDASRDGKMCKSTKGYRPNYGTKMTISGDGHADQYLDYLIQLFWGRGAQQTNFPLPVRDLNKDGQWPDNFYYENMTVSTACDNLKERQLAMLKGPQAFFVHGEKNVNLDGRIVTPYPAIALDEDMKDIWEKSVTEMLNQTPPGWLQQNVYMADVPKESPLYNILKAKGVQEMPPKGPGFKIKMPGGMGDVKPPKPPEQSGTGKGLPQRMPKKKKKPKDEGMSTGQKLAAGAAVGAAGYIAWRVATGRKTISLPKLPKLPGRS